MVTRLVTQFDGPSSRSRRDLLVATPTCCSCCCCLVSTATLSTLAAVHVHEASVVGAAARGRRVGLTVAAAAALPLCLLLAIAVVAVAPSSTSVLVVAGLAVAAVWGCSLAVLYRLAGHRRSWRPVALLVAGGSAAFVLELFTLGFFVYGQLAALVIPALAGGYLARRLGNRRSLLGAGGARTPS